MAHSLSDEQVQEISAAVFAGRKIAAIKLYRQATGAGLKDAKDFIEALEARLRAQSPELFTSPAGAGCSRTAALLLVLAMTIYWLVQTVMG